MDSRTYSEQGTTGRNVEIERLELDSKTVGYILTYRVLLKLIYWQVKNRYDIIIYRNKKENKNEQRNYRKRNNCIFRIYK